MLPQAELVAEQPAGDGVGVGSTVAVAVGVAVGVVLAHPPLVTLISTEVVVYG